MDGLYWKALILMDDVGVFPYCWKHPYGKKTLWPLGISGSKKDQVFGKTFDEPFKLFTVATNGINSVKIRFPNPPPVG